MSVAAGKFEMSDAEIMKLSDIILGKISLMLLGITIPLVVPSNLSAEPFYEKINYYGPGFVYEGEEKVYFLVGEIRENDSFEIRRLLRDYNIEFFVLNSPGGLVFESLQIAGIVNDNNISTIVPETAVCASACSFIYFAGKQRFVGGDLGVHQFSSDSGNIPTDLTQYTTSEIISFLNGFETPAFVYEKMFRSSEFYFFDEMEKNFLSNYPQIDNIIDQYQIGKILADFLQSVKPETDVVYAPQVEVKFENPEIRPRARPNFSMVLGPLGEEGFFDMEMLLYLAKVSFRSSERKRTLYFSDSDFEDLHEALKIFLPVFLPSVYPEDKEIVIHDLRDLLIDLLTRPRVQFSIRYLYYLMQEVEKDFVMDDVFVHGDWFSMRNGRNCLAYTEGIFRNPNLAEWPLKLMVEFRQNWPRHGYQFNFPFPSIFQASDIALFVDGESIPHTVYYFDNYNYTLLPVGYDGSNVDEPSFAKVLSRGNTMEILGANYLDSAYSSVKFSLLGFTEALTRIQNLCRVPEARRLLSD